MSQPSILVTGGTGFIASWIIYMLLEKGYTVHATTRSLDKPEKRRHLDEPAAQLPGELKWFEADLLDEGSFAEAMKGCQHVLHTASPFQISGIKDPQRELIDPALKGTQNVLNTVSRHAEVRKVVLTSSVVAIYSDATDTEATENGILNETHWNTASTLKHQPYSLSKTLAEREAWKIQEGQDWQLATINPGFVLGPSLTPRTDSTSIATIKSLMEGDYKSGVPHLEFGVVDVREVARAHIEAMERQEVEGRHILVGDHATLLDMADLVDQHFPGEYALPKKELPKALFYLLGPFLGYSWKYINRNVGQRLRFDNSRSIKNLGIQYRPFSETIRDQVQQLRETIKH